MKKLFIENDDQIDRMSIEILEDLFEKEFKFDIEITDSGSEGMRILEVLKECDEIYCQTSFIPSLFYSSANLFNNLMYHVIDRKIEGKSLFIFNQYDNIKWYNLKKELLTDCFLNLNNKIFVQQVDEETCVYSWIMVDIEKLINEQFN